MSSAERTGPGTSTDPAASTGSTASTEASGSTGSIEPRARPPEPGEPWTILRLILWSQRYLDQKGVPEPRLDAEHLLAHALDTDRLRLYLEYDRPLTPDELQSFKPLLLRRAGREPLQYIVGRTPFRELDLITDPRVLIPRPETEVLVGEVLEWAAGTGRDDLAAVDVGTGTGAIALSLAVEGPFARVVATDVDPDALDVARENRARAGMEERVELRGGDLLEAIPGERFDLLVSNPPYVADGQREGLQPEVRDWEPLGALLAGEGGMRVLEALVRDAADHLRPDGLLALEVGEGQAGVVAERIRETGAFAEPRVRRDLQGRERIVLAARAGGA